MSEEKRKFLEGSHPKHSFLLGLFIGVAVISFISFIAILIFMSNSATRSETIDDTNKVVEANKEAPLPSQEPTSPTPSADLPKVTDNDHIDGPANASVTMIVYDDFECPFCKKFQKTLIQAREEYKGQVRFVFRHFPLSFHQNAHSAAVASECAAEQGKFWEFADALYEQDNLGESVYKNVAKNLGLNINSFDECIVSDKYDQKIKDQIQTGAAAGVKGTPGSFVNGELVSGAVPYENLKAIIDSKL